MNIPDPGDIPRRFYARRVDDREVAELLGLCKGIIADGVVSEEEAIAVKTWMQSHPHAAAGFPGREICERLDAIFRDGLVEMGEREELGAMLADVVGERADRTGTMRDSTRLPLNDPEPTLFFEGREFVFTGHFCLSRSACHLRVTERAGVAAGSPRGSTDYVVIGTIASEGWLTAAWGTKILKAMEMRDAGHKLAIVSEAHWLASIDQGG